MPTQSSQELQEAPSTLAANARHADKLAHRKAHPEKLQHYAPNRGAGSIAEISDDAARHQAKLEARIAAFKAGRKPDEDGHLNVDLSRPDKAERAAVEAKAKEEAAKAEPKGDDTTAKASKGDKAKADAGKV